MELGQRGETQWRPHCKLGNRSVREQEAEVAKLRKKLAVERMEMEVLKKPGTLPRSCCQVRVREIKAN